MKKICEIKKSHIFDDIPDEFTQYIHHCKNLTFTDKPDYNYLKIYLFVYFANINILWILNMIGYKLTINYVFIF